jgi:hypothetical protein
MNVRLENTKHGNEHIKNNTIITLFTNHLEQP